jgi:hypothetical protein
MKEVTLSAGQPTCSHEKGKEDISEAKKIIKECRK